MLRQGPHRLLRPIMRQVDRLRLQLEYSRVVVVMDRFPVRLLVHPITNLWHLVLLLLVKVRSRIVVVATDRDVRTVHRRR